MKSIYYVISVLFLCSSMFAQENWYLRYSPQQLKIIYDKEFIGTVDDTMFLQEESGPEISLNSTREYIATTGVKNHHFVKTWEPTFNNYVFFGDPTDVAIDKEGCVYVTDFEYQRIKKFTADGKLITKWGGEGDGDGLFDGPWSIAVDRDGYVYVTDVYNQRIQKFTSSGEFVTKWGNDGDVDWIIYGIAVDNDGYIYVIVGNGRIQKFTSNGEFISTWATRREGLVKYDGTMIGANPLTYAASTDSGGITGKAIYSALGLGPDDFPPEVNGNIALIKRGEIPFAEKVRRAQDAGAIGVIIFNNEPGSFWGTLGTERDELKNRDWIPGVSVSEEDGQSLVEADNPTITLEILSHGDGEFVVPFDIVIDQDGYVYVTDVYNHRVRKFTPSGEFVTKWGSEGNEEGEFSSPHGITVDKNGFVYVVDRNNHRIQKFTSDGEFITMWGNDGDSEGQFKLPAGIAVNGFDYIYIVDRINRNIQQFTLDAMFVNSWGGPGHPDPDKVTITYYDRHNRPGYTVNGYGAHIGQYVYEGGRLTRIDYYDSAHMRSIGGITIGMDGHVYMATIDLGSRYIQRYDYDGNFINEWCGGKYDSPYQFWRAISLATDKDNHLYIIDKYNSILYDQYGNRIGDFPRIRVRKIDENGDLVHGWNIIRSGSQAAITIDKDSYIYLTSGNSVHKYDLDGELITSWGNEGDGEGEFNVTRGIVVDQNSYVYVVDSENNRIQKFTSDGEFVTMWGGQGHGEGEFNYPHGIVVDRDGDVLVTDKFNHRVQKFTPDGEFVTLWGSFGDGEGKFNHPQDIVVDEENYIYVLDTGNIRVQKFTFDGEPIFVDKTDFLPLEFSLLQNYPNPFNPSTTIRYGIPERSHVHLSVYNYLGQRVTNLVNQEQDAQYHEISFDASHLPSGVYIYRLQAGEYVESRKMLYIR